jgi:RsiW-degrading membrane proteinase PrsW (M82 family)
VSAAATVSAAEARVRRVSPIAVAMLLVIAIGAWNLWNVDGQLAIALGVPGLAAWGAWAIYGLVAVTIVVAVQRFADRPATGMLLALAWGGLAATWAAESANAAASTIFLRVINSDPHAWLSTPVIEESLKAVGVLGVILIPVLRRVRPLDGLFYGVLVGAGFQVVEDAIYTTTSLFQNPGEPGPAIIATVVMRGFTIGLFTHAVYTGIVGAGIAWAACAPAGQRLRRSLGATGVLVAVMAAHGIFNTQDTIDVINLAASLIPFVVLLLVIRAMRRSEMAFLGAEAARQDGWGELGSDEVALIGAARPIDKHARRLRDRVIAFAWAADRLEPGTRRYRRAVERLAAARSGSA